MRKRLFIWCTCGVFTIAVCAAVIALVQRDTQGQKTPPESIQQLVNVENRIENLTVVQTELRNADSLGGSVVIVVRNDSDKPITHITVVSGDEKSTIGTTFAAKDAVLVEPHKQYEMSYSFSKVRKGFPIRIGGVMYSDNTTVGDQRSQERLRSQKEHEKEMKPEANSPR